ncbi:putative bifunctional diguanylate cyclase/phosphodiesterase [Marinomonas transparens]|uniref:EAL domain-containing protein n=1 Tax=Marinomonas transparens TaxID=2795388 RepID=A0A934JUU9_9GAMM|nr:EAL domain-containing protein [Marinomonas transparens]MBJ7538712.1 EAL domain-containing protein [Marinomonas transparens]
MPPILEFQRDKSFRLRLIVVCLGVALLVSTIYVTVSYRLASDLGINAEQTSLHRQAMLLHAELLEEGDEGEDNLEERMAELVNLIYLNDHIRANSLYVEARSKDFDWTLSNNMSIYQIVSLKKRLTIKKQESMNPMANGVEKLDGQRFLWQVVEMQDYNILIIEAPKSIEEALSLIIRRLSITSIMIFWLAAWLAITISSWMTKRVQDKNDALARLATHDSLTGLPNRLYLTNLLQDLMPDTPLAELAKVDDALIEEQVSGSLFVIDLDKFKEVNDAFGHAAGDTLLKKVSQRISATLENNHTLVRVGGDEFIVWAPDLEIEKAILLAKELVLVCDEPVMINKLAINTGASIGICHYPTHATNAEALIIGADTAMYDAKQERTGWSLFNERDTEIDRLRLRLRADLGEALVQHQIKLYYQPKVELSTGRIASVEGLARWHHPTDGILTPHSFIDLVEHSGRVQEFGRYIIHAAITQLAEWQKQGVHIPVAINLSPYNLLDPGLLNFTLQLLDELRISPNMLEIELIESSTNITIEQIAPRLSKFKEAGIKLAIDDFGTGMSSLSYISSLNVDTIKIDRSFITEINIDPKKQIIVAAALTLANSFGNQTIAEGIENQAQLEMLKQMNCLYGQGYYFARPMPADEMFSLLQSKQSLPISDT